MMGTATSFNGGGEGLRTAHVAEPGGGNPAAGEVAAAMAAANSSKVSSIKSSFTNSQPVLDAPKSL